MIEDKPPIETTFPDWHSRLRAGDSVITSRLWELYFQRMVLLARKRLRDTRTAARDEEDVALSAFKSFCLGIRAGRIELDRDDVNLWPLLVTITINKAVDHVRHENRQKRGGTANEPAESLLENAIGPEPSPELVAAASESLESLLACLDRTNDPMLREIAIVSMEGNSATEIAIALKCSPRTVQRKLKTIRQLWQSEAQS
ncbi:ECF-type sigma factor [Rubripirellula tenax]|uniref:ECF-type sigma factor n=1 Tax=Rubripirellula tenax TaxID=2528015 RepID=UPI001C966CB8|nr:ECF-type sigma factor [Rubripirellula tenax]